MTRRITHHLTHNKSLNRYVKKVDGRIVYFGDKGCSKSEAMKELGVFIKARESEIEQFGSDVISIGYLSRAYDADCEIRRQSGALGMDTFKEYRRCIARFISETGEETLVTNLRPAHFRAVRAFWKDHSPPTIARYVRAVRTMFQWGIDNALLRSLPLYGREFEVPDKSEHRASRESTERKHGERKFSTDDLRKLLNHPLCDGWLRACVFLALNAGMYGKDCSDLLWKEIRPVGGVMCVDRVRFKTRVQQTAPLWPETIALLDVLRRPHYKPDDTVFRTPLGNPIIGRDTSRDYLAKHFNELREGARVHRRGVGFGSFRHTHVSAVGDVGDDNAARRVRGHEIAGVVVHYDKVSVERLKRVTDLARQRLLTDVLNERVEKPSQRRKRVG